MLYYNISFILSQYSLLFAQKQVHSFFVKFGRTIVLFSYLYNEYILNLKWNFNIILSTEQILNNYYREKTVVLSVYEVDIMFLQFNSFKLQPVTRYKTV